MSPLTGAALDSPFPAPVAGSTPVPVPAPVGRAKPQFMYCAWPVPDSFLGAVADGRVDSMTMADCTFLQELSEDVLR